MAIVLTILVSVVSILLRPLAEEHSQRQHLGAEYYNVARALVDGRGFSDPFGERTGPTAWVSPLYPALLATLLSLFGKKSAVATIVVWLTNASTVVGGVTLYALARRTLRRLSPLVPLVFYILWLAAFFYWFFLLTSDIWLLMLVGVGMTATGLRYTQDQCVQPVKWGIWGGLASVVSPALALAWGCLGVGLWLRSRSQSRSWLLAGAIMASAAAPWTLRNAVVFHAFIPTKANLGYEQFQANLVDQDGVYDVRTFEQHPYNRLSERFEFTRTGEQRYIGEHGQLFSGWAEEHPRELASKIWNRLTAALVRYVPLWPIVAGSLDDRWASFAQVLLPIPTLLVLAGLFFRRGEHARALRLFGVFFAIYLSGYVLFAYYMRFLLPLTPLLLLMASWGLDHLLGLRRRNEGHVVEV